MEFLRSFLRSHFAWKPVMASRNVGCFVSLDMSGDYEPMWVIPGDRLSDNAIVEGATVRVFSSQGHVMLWNFSCFALFFVVNIIVACKTMKILPPWRDPANLQGKHNRLTEGKAIIFLRRTPFLIKGKPGIPHLSQYSSSRVHAALT